MKKEEEIEEKGVIDSINISELLDPFPGLRPFGVEESHLFFGREGQSDEVLMKLAENKFIAILGTSGSGKSSLMYCGLIPTLYGGFMTQAGSNWNIVVTRPGGGPIDNLAEALLIKDKNYNELEFEEQLIRKTITSTVLRSSSLGLIEVVKQLKKGNNENTFILVDQFEELFRYKKLETVSSDFDESSAFVNLLLEAVYQYDAPIYVALTMRSDFIGDCASFSDLTKMINDSHYLIPQMTRDQKRLAIEGPVAVGGGKIAPRLTQQLLNDVGDNPDQLPIVQHALMRTWSYWKEYRKENEPLDLKHYNAIGTLKEALSQHANEAYDTLSKREQKICEVMFKALTERGTEVSGIRRPTKLATIAAIAGVNEEEVIKVIDKFREPGRTLLMPPHGIRLKSETVIDISHESLMRIWVRLKSWLDEESRAAEMYLKLSESAVKYQGGGARLWKMPDLQLAISWREENKPTHIWCERYAPNTYEFTKIFLATSERVYETEQANKQLLQKKALRKSRIVAFILAFAMLICIYFVVLSTIKADQATKSTAKAEKLAQEAIGLTKTAQDETAKAEKSAKEAIIAGEQAKKAQKEAEKEAENARVAEENALLAKSEAEKSAQIAKQAEIKAEKEAENARVAEKEAEKNAEHANKLRFQSIANSMAIKSTKIKNDAKQQGLIARQAWKFNDEFGDENHSNGDIYAGVYYALKALKEEDTVFQGFKDNNFTGHLGAVRSVVYSKDGKSLYSASSDGKILKWDMSDDKRTKTLIFQHNFVNRVIDILDISNDESHLVLAGSESGILLFDLNSIGSKPEKLEGDYSGFILDLVFLPDNSGFFFTSLDGIIRKNNFKSKSSTIVDTVSSIVKTLTISHDGTNLAGGAKNGKLLIWELNNGNKRRELYVKKGLEITALTFDNEGKFLVFGDSEGLLKIWDMKEKRLIKTLTGHSSVVSDIEFSKDNTLLASSGYDGTANIWVMEYLDDFPVLLDDHGKGIENNKWVWSVSFNPDGNLLVTGGGDGNIRLWPVKPDGMANEICGFLSKNMSELTWDSYVGKDIDYQKTCEGLVKDEE